MISLINYDSSEVAVRSLFTQTLYKSIYTMPDHASHLPTGMHITMTGRFTRILTDSVHTAAFELPLAQPATFQWLVL